MVTKLTTVGWETANGNLLGRWSNGGDRVNRGDEIKVASEVAVDTLAGDDYIIAGSEFGKVGVGIFNRGTIKTNHGHDSVIGSIKSNFNATGISNFRGTIDTGKGNDIVSGITLEAKNQSTGIINSGTIKTEKGNDIVSGYVRGASCIGIHNYGAIKTGLGEDLVLGNARGASAAGIRNVRNGKIDTEEGDDLIRGTGSNLGISNFGTIETGSGNDFVIGSVSEEVEGSGTGISNSGTIKTEDGNDTVDAFTGGFSGGFNSLGTIDLGQGDDLIRGFGEQIVNGGKDFDTAELGIDYDQTLISLGSSFDIQIGDMSFTDVERFVFNDIAYSLQDLQLATTTI